MLTKVLDKIIGYLKINANCRGFSLTELSISLAIIAVIAGSTLSLAVTSDRSVKLHETKGKMEHIQEALLAYLSNNKRLPCPADGTLAQSNANFGIEATTGINPMSCNANFNDGSNIYYGVVPVTTLQLPDDFMFDGWGNRISYAVDIRYANNLTTNANCSGQICFRDVPAGTSIIVRDASATARTSRAIYVLYSHGANGHGAFLKNGGATRINAYATSTGTPFTDSASYADELENAHLNAAGSNTTFNNIFVDRDYINFSNTTVAANKRYFDDVVMWKTKKQIVNELGYQLYSSLCNDAATVINNPSSNNCTGAASEANCNIFANQINQLCLQ